MAAAAAGSVRALPGVESSSRERERGERLYSSGVSSSFFMVILIYRSRGSYSRVSLLYIDGTRHCSSSRRRRRGVSHITRLISTQQHFSYINIKWANPPKDRKVQQNKKKKSWTPQKKKSIRSSVAIRNVGEGLVIGFVIYISICFLRGTHTEKAKKRGKRHVTDNKPKSARGGFIAMTTRQVESTWHAVPVHVPLSPS